MPSAPDELRVAFRSVFPGVMLAMFLASVDQTILASALPAIVASLGGFADLSWVIVAYLLAATVAAPLYGHIGDRFGRRATLLAALAVFTLASLACALAPTLWALILARALQGLGGGGLMTLSQALIGENVPPRQRAHFQGYFAAVFAASSMLGPVLGALLTEYASWRAVFFINLPLGAIAALLAWRIPRHAPPQRPRFRPDFAGVILFAIGLPLILFALSSAGNRFAWADWRLYAILALGIAVLTSLVVWERRAADPIIPVRLLASPAIWRSNVVVACLAASLFGAVLYLPLYLQIGRGFGIGASGLLLVPITLSAAVVATFTGRQIARTGRLTGYTTRGFLLSTAAFAALALSVASAPIAVIIALTLLAGAGLGTPMPPTQIIVQTAAGSASLGSGIASISVSRSIGGALGVAIVGAVLFVLVGREDSVLASVLPHLRESGGAALANVAPAARAAIGAQLDRAFEVAFAVLAAFTAIGAYAASKVPAQRL